MAKTPPSPEAFLMQQDKTLHKLISLLGPADLGKNKKEFFDSLTRTIIGQQISTSAANSITKRIEAAHGQRPFKAEKFIALSPEDLKSCGISNSKIKTILGIADAHIAGELSHQVLAPLEDSEVLKKLTSYWGIGNWTAEIFMMYSLNRMDILALGDAGLIRAHRILYPAATSLEVTSQNWRPYRAVAAWYLWRFLDNPEYHDKVLNG